MDIPSIIFGIIFMFVFMGIGYHLGYKSGKKLGEGFSFFVLFKLFEKLTTPDRKKIMHILQEIGVDMTKKNGGIEQ